MATARTKKKTVAAADRLISRELSFLDYDARVLELAADTDLPLLERVRFCAIFADMLDEFFMTRVAGLIGQASAGLNVRSPDGRTPQQAIADAREVVLELYATQARVWSRELVPALAEEGIVVSRVEDLAAELESSSGRTIRGLSGAHRSRSAGSAVPFISPPRSALRWPARSRDR